MRMKKATMIKECRRVLLLLILTAFGLVIWIPLWMLFTGALMGTDELKAGIGPILLDSGRSQWSILPLYPTLQPLVELLLDTPTFFVMFWNSCIQVFPILIGQLAVGAPAAWAFARFSFPGRKWIYSLYIALMLLPFQVTMVSSYLVLDRLGLLNTIWSIILPGAFSTFPVFIMVRFFSAIPGSLMEAAELDGAGPLRTFLYVGIPLGAPGILSAMVLSFLEYWNALEQPLTFLKEKSLWPLSLYLPNITIDNAGISMMASAVMMAPAILIFLFGQQYLEQGIAAAGVKE